MHEDDEGRFPRISFWQLLKGALQVFATTADKISSGVWLADLISLGKARFPRHGADDVGVAPGKAKTSEGTQSDA